MAIFSSLYGSISTVLKNTNSANDVDAQKSYINEAVREIWLAHPWNFKLRDDVFINTKAIYNTGVITATRGSTTLTITGGSLTGLEGYKFALATDAPPYMVLSVAVGGLSATLENAYAETTISTAGFIIYKDEYELPESVRGIHSVVLMRAGYPELFPVSMKKMYRYTSTQIGGQTIPLWYNTQAPPTALSTSKKATHIKLAPIPNDIFPIKVVYEIAVDDMVEDDDECPLPDEFVPCIRQWALMKAYQNNAQPELQATAFQTATAHLETLRAHFVTEVQRTRVLNDMMRRRGRFANGAWLTKLALDGQAGNG